MRFPKFPLRNSLSGYSHTDKVSQRPNPLGALALRNRHVFMLALMIGLISGETIRAQGVVVPSPPAEFPPMTLSEYQPKSQLIVPQTRLTQAKFPVVDVHTHFRIRLRHDEAALKSFLEVMDRNQIALCCSLDGTLGSIFEEHRSYLWDKHRNRFLIFANIDFQGNAPPDRYDQWACNQPDFVHRTTMELRRAKELGISGLKVFKQLGLGYRNADGSWLAIDDERLDPIWKTCGELGLPVLMHTADPSAFFEPIDANNERYEELSRHPDWAFPADRFPSRRSLHEARNRVIQRHPQTIFIAAHLGNDGEDLAQTSKWLDELPNLYIEFASRISELGRQPRQAKRFLEKYADRILFGTDGPWPEERLRLYWRFLETEDEYFPYSEKPIPPQGLWNISGVDLDDSILRKIYHENAVRMIPGVREKLEAWQAQHP